MEKRIHLYVSRKNVLTWLMAVCMVCSAVARIALSGLKGSGDTLYVWSQIVLPTAATLLYAAIALIDGKEMFYKTAIPVWMMAIYSGIWISANVEGKMMVWLFWIALVFFASLYTDITAGRRKHAVLLLVPVVASPLCFILYFYRESLLAGDWNALLPSLPDILLLAGCLLQIGVVMAVPLAEVFGVCPLSWLEWMVVAGLSLVPLPVVELEKWQNRSRKIKMEG